MLQLRNHGHSRIDVQVQTTRERSNGSAPHKILLWRFRGDPARADPERNPTLSPTPHPAQKPERHRRSIMSHSRSVENAKRVALAFSRHHPLAAFPPSASTSVTGGRSQAQKHFWVDKKVSRSIQHTCD
jgi:hypothetical protein